MKLNGPVLGQPRLNATAFAVLLAAILAAPGCSSDAGESGSAATDANGAGTGGDGQVLGDGSGATDGSSTSDSAGSDGTASGTDSAVTDAGADGRASTDAGAADSAGVDGGQDTATTDAGKSDAGKSDAGTTDASGGDSTTQVIACLTKECNAEVSTCLADSDCVKAIGCITGCKGDNTCMLGCGTGLSGSAQQALLGAAQCGMQKGCIDLGGGGGGGGNKCGDGTCDLGEQLTCPQDCPNPCGNGTCDLGEQFLCPQDCPGGGGGGGASCGDGTCDAPAENPFTCAQDCKAPQCGDGVCDLPFETTLTCAADCSGGGGGGGAIDMTGCLLNQCGSESLACTTDFTGCLQAGLCVGGCKDMTCVAKCGDKLTGGAADKFIKLRDCIQQKCAANP